MLQTRAVLEDFADTFTGHGYPLLIRARAIKAKIFWAVICCFATVGFIWQGSELIKEYFNYPTAISLEIQPGNVDFPYVTLCNLNPVDIVASDAIFDVINNRSNGYFTEEERERIYRVYDTFEKEMDIMKAIEREQNLTGKPYGPFNQTLIDAHVSLVYGIDHAHVLFGDIAFNKLGIKRDQFIWQCVFDGSPCNMTTQFKSVFDPRFYNCSTFVPPRVTHPEKGIILNQGLSIIVFPGIGTQYIPQNIMTTKYTNWFETFSPYDDMEGVRVIIHGQDTWPHPRHRGFNVAPGHAVSIKLKETIINRIDTPKRPCQNVSFTVTGSSDELRYTLYHCQEQCYLDQMAQKLGCYDGLFHRGIAKKEPVCLQNLTEEIHRLAEECSTSVEKCYGDVVRLFNKTDAFVNQRNHFNLTECDCAVACNEVVYDATTTINPWPRKARSKTFDYELFQNIFRPAIKQRFAKEPVKLSLLEDEFFGTAITNGSNFTTERQMELMSHFTMINIDFSDDNVHITQEKKLYEIASLLSGIGGDIGLWIGLSAISVVEVFYLVYRLMRICVGNIKCSPKTKNGRTNNDAGGMHLGYDPCAKTEF